MPSYFKVHRSFKMHLWGPGESISFPCFSVFRQALVTSVDVAWCLSPCVSFLSECSATSCQNVCAGSKSLAQQSSKCFGAQCLRMEPPRRMEAHGRTATKCKKKKKIWIEGEEDWMMQLWLLHLSVAPRVRERTWGLDTKSWSHTYGGPCWVL